MASTQKPKWQFVQHADGAHPMWTWTRFLLSGEVEVHSEPFPDYGNAVYDAMKKGFDPSLDRWSVTNNTGTVHYNGLGEGQRSAPLFVKPDLKSVPRREGSEPDK